MSEWPLLEGNRYQTIGADAGTSSGTAMTAGGANTKGNYVVLSASTPFDCQGILVWMVDPNTLEEYLIDIAVGAGGVEEVIVENLSYCTGNGTSGFFYNIPVSIPAGSRVAARAQCNVGSKVLDICITLMAQGFLPSQPLGLVRAYGANTGDSGGVQIDPGGTVNTKGAYSELTAATTYEARAIFLAWPNQSNSSRSAGEILLDVAIGAGGVEQIIIPDIALNFNGGCDMVTPFVVGPLMVNIPVGTRLAVRAQSSLNDAVDRLFDCIIYGVT